MDKGAVGKKIRELRRRYSVTGKVLAQRTGLSAAAISKFERGLLRPTENFIAKAIEALSLQKTDANALLEMSALFQSQFLRWNNSSDQLTKNQVFIGKRERNARSIRSFWLHIVPGLLQHESYMRHILRSFSMGSDQEIGKIIAARQKRQQILNRQNRSFVFVLGEASLRTIVGSTIALRDQLIHLEEVSKANTAIELRILPFDKVLTRVPMHHFVLYDERTVEIEINKGQVDLWTDEDVAFHVELMNYLVASSLPPIKSLELIEKIRRGLD